MKLAHALAASDLRAALNLNRDEAEGLRGLIATTTSADIRAWAGVRLDQTRKESRIRSQKFDALRLNSKPTCLRVQSPTQLPIP